MKTQRRAGQSPRPEVPKELCLTKTIDGPCPFFSDSQGCLTVGRCIRLGRVDEFGPVAETGVAKG